MIKITEAEYKDILAWNRRAVKKTKHNYWKWTA